MLEGMLLTDTEFEILFPLLETRIPYNEDDSFFADEEEWENGLTNLLEDSKGILLSKLFPFEDYSKYTIPTHKYNWVIRCCIELYNLADKMGITNYAENGLSWTKYTDGLSRSLTSELVSHAGIPKRVETMEMSEENAI